MNFFSAPSRSASMAVFYITVGVLVMIWTCVWYSYVATHEEVADWQKYVSAGLFLSGLSVMVIGLLMGRIGSSAKEADNTIATPTVPVDAHAEVPAVGAVPAVPAPPTAGTVPTNGAVRAPVAYSAHDRS